SGGSATWDYVGPMVDALMQPMVLRDSDGDFLPDYVENRDGSGTVAAGQETDWTNADTDGDGLTDSAEIFICHSDPLDAYSGNRRANGGTRTKDGPYYLAVWSQTCDPDYNPDDTKTHLTIGAGPNGTLRLTLVNALANWTYDIYLSAEPCTPKWTRYV